MSLAAGQSAESAPLSLASPKTLASTRILAHRRGGRTEAAQVPKRTHTDKPPATRFDRTRRAHQSEIGEDYVEAIQQLSSGTNGARVTDLAALMGVSHVTVVRTVSRLGKAGLVETSRGKPVRLTRAGTALALKARRRHEAVLAFLRGIGVSAKQAEIDAEGIEHHVSEETIRAMRRVTLARSSGRD